jgi:undecaprenyl-diphosphatase
VKRVEAFDRWADELLEGLRGNRSADWLFSTASHLGDFSVLWHILGLARGVSRSERERQALALAAVLGIESVLVNQGIKRLFKRVRPTESGDERYAMRTPSSSSFPSGHASSAFTAATVLTAFDAADGRRTAPIWFTLAIVVALSRAYVRIHHASDVIGGVAAGLVLGAIAKRVLRKLGAL